VTVLHVAAGNTYGGIERLLVTLASATHPAMRQGVVIAFGGRFERELQDAGVSVHRLPSPRASRPLMVWRARRAFMEVQAKVAPEVAIFHSAWPHAMFASTARAGGARIGFWQHAPVTTPAWPDRWARFVRPDFTVFNSRFTGARPAFPDVPGHVIHCAVARPPAIDPGVRRSLRASLGAGDDDIVVLMAARLERWKGHDVLIEAARRLPGDARIHVWIAGADREPGSRYERDLATAAAGVTSGTRVSLLGERDDVPTLMRLADIYCQPNLKGEPFGIAIAEAMLASLPCVVSAAGGAAELLDDSCSVITAPGDAAAVADALLGLAADCGLRARMGEAGASRASTRTDPAGRLQELVEVLSCLQSS
jgi:glycosyltransferase involved in cell wall biosynthesis